jgi:hypothetical protein
MDLQITLTTISAGLPPTPRPVPGSGGPATGPGRGGAADCLAWSLESWTPAAFKSSFNGIAHTEVGEPRSLESQPANRRAPSGHTQRYRIVNIYRIHPVKLHHSKMPWSENSRFGVQWSFTTGHAGYDLTIEISWRHAIQASHTPPFSVKKKKKKSSIGRNPILIICIYF